MAARRSNSRTIVSRGTKRPAASERYRSKARKSKAVEPKEGKKDLRFWTSDEPHKTIFDAVARISNRTRARRRQDLFFACLYDDAELASLIEGQRSLDEFAPQTMSANIVRRQVDTMTSRLSKNRPMPMALTTGGNYAQQRRAKALSKYFEGELDAVKYWPTRTLRIRDGGIFGSGLAHNYRVGAKRIHERIYPWELRVDPWEAQHGNPRTLYLRRFIDRLVLQERFPDFAELIEDADSKTDEDHWEIGWDETCDLVLVNEAWHLPSGPDADDGAHAMAVSTGLLGEVTEYKREYFPFSKFDYSPPVVGWWGEGMVKQLRGLQFEVNSIGLRMQEQAYMTGSYILVPDDCGIETDVLDNGALSIIRYRGAKPEWQNPAPFHPQFLSYYMALRGQFPGEITGQSGLATRSEKPAGLDSGKAIRTYHDIDNENLITQGRTDELDALDTCWQLLDLAEEIYSEKDKGGKAYAVQTESRTHGRSVLEDINYADVRLDREQFTLRVFPTSFLASTPEDRWAQVQEMINAGFLSQDEAMALLDFPDLERVMNLRGSARRNIERLLQKILESDDPEKDYEMPIPAWNLELCKALALTTYLDAKLDGAPEENLEWILQFSLDAQAELDDAAAGSNDAAATAQVDAGAPIDGAAPSPDAGAQYAPPGSPPLPANAVAPQAMPALPPV